MVLAAPVRRLLAVRGLAIRRLAIRRLAIRRLAVGGLAIRRLAVRRLAVRRLAVGGLVERGLPIRLAVRRLAVCRRHVSWLPVAWLPVAWLAVSVFWGPRPAWAGLVKNGLARSRLARRTFRGRGGDGRCGYLVLGCAKRARWGNRVGALALRWAEPVGGCRRPLGRVVLVVQPSLVVAHGCCCLRLLTKLSLPGPVKTTYL